MKTRIVYPQLWHDTKFCECSVEAKTLFMFIITNPYLGLSRYSRISDRQIIFHTGLSGKKLEEAKNELSTLKWCFFSNEWVYHNHNCAYIDYTGNQKVSTSKEGEISKVPQDIKGVINGLLTGQRPDINYKSKTKKEGSVRETVEKSGKRYSALSDLGQPEFDQLAQELQISVTTVEKKYQRLVGYCKSKGKRYKDYLATLRNWLNGDLDEGKLKKVIKYIPVDLPVISQEESEKVRILMEEKRKIGILT